MTKSDIIELNNKTGADYNRCYQCKTCTLSCPFTAAMDYLPHQIVRKAQLGQLSEILSCNTIWYCASCETCVTRCPNQVDIPRLMDALRQKALQEKTSVGNASIPLFHRLFLAGIRQWGRQYELGLLLGFKLKGKDLFSDLGIGIKMLLKNKLEPLPVKSPGSRDVKTIFRKLKWMA